MTDADSPPLVVLDKVNKHFGDTARAARHRPDRRHAARSSWSSARPARASRRCAATINRLEPIDSGTISLDGQPLPAEGKALARLRADVGMVFQSFNLFAHKTVLENVTLGPTKVKGVSRAAGGARRR